MQSLYKRLGGANALEDAVAMFYNKVLEDPRIAPFFAQTDLDRLRRHQQRFLTFAFGGTEYYPGPAMRQAHKRLVDQYGITDLHFDAVLENLADTLQELGFSGPTIIEALTIAESVRNDVLGL